MENRKLLNQNSVVLALVILSSVLLRIIPHPPNFAPVGGLALFSGAKLSGKKAFLIPLATMLISDLFLGFHSTMFYVYFSFLLIVLIGKTLSKKAAFTNLVLASLLSSIVFFLITNFGVWFEGNIYAKNIIGLTNAYLMGVPFFRNTLLGDLLYTFSFFYGYRYLLIFSKKLIATYTLKV